MLEVKFKIIKAEIIEVNITFLLIDLNKIANDKNKNGRTYIL